MKGTPFEQRAREYVAGALPHGTGYEKQKLLEDWFGKEAAAKGICDDFTKRAGNPVGASVLDIGFGNGVTAGVFAQRGAHVSGLEVSSKLVSFATDYLKSKNISAGLALYKGDIFPFDDGTFDYIYSVSVLEHVSDPVALMKESHRVLKPGGKFYLAFPNRLNPKETHTGVWFLSYLPRSVASALLGLFRRNSIPDLNLHFLSYFWLRRLLARNKIGLTVLLDREGRGVRKIIKNILAVFGIHHSAILPHVMVILQKQ